MLIFFLIILLIGGTVACVIFDEAQMLYIAIKNLRVYHSDLHIVANALNSINKYYPKNIKTNLIEQLQFFTTQLSN